MRIANTCCIGYPHDGRADNAAYRHDRRADNAAYRHDRRADSLSRQNLFWGQSVVALTFIETGCRGRKIGNANVFIDSQSVVGLLELGWTLSCRWTPESCR